MLRARLAVLLTALMLFAVPLAAQETETPDYEAWQKIASQAEELPADASASDQQLADTRAAIVEWRGRFQQAQNVNASRIATVKDQIDALGPAPAEGATEEEEVATRRADLQKQLSTLQAPRLTAVEAFSRADAIIKQIDEATAERQAVVLARLSPSPFLPETWAQAGKDGLELVDGVGSSAVARFTDQTLLAQIRPQLPQIAGYLIAALLLLTYGRRWIGSLPSRLSARASEHSRAVVAFVVSLGQIAIPMIGLLLLIRAIKATGVPGPWILPFLDALPPAGVILFAGSWLARQLFPRRAIAYDTLEMDIQDRNAARRMVNSLAVLLAIHHLLSSAVLQLSGLYERIGDQSNRVPFTFSEGATSVWHYTLIVLAGLALFRLGNILRRLRTRGQDRNMATRHKILGITGLLTRIVIVLVLVLGALGFINLANAVIWPWVLTLALIMVLILLQDFIADLFEMVKRGEEGARDGLAPLLIGFSLIVLSVPLFLIIWGARRTDLAEYWEQITRGVSLGGINLSPGSVLTFMVIFAIGYSITRVVQSALRISVLPKTKLDPGGQSAIVSGIGYIGIVLAAIMAVTSAGIDLSSLAIVAGALSVGIGFGMQNIVSNFVSGIILLIERPVSVGDWISAGGQQGIVKRISVRSTQVETFDKTEVIVPNSDLISQPVTNWTRHNQTGRIIIPIGVAYGSDTRKVERILREIIEDQPLVTIDPAPAVLFRTFGADSMDFEIRAVLSDVSAGMRVTSEVNHLIVERFAAEEIEIPFPQRDVWLRNPEALRGEAPPAKPLPIAKEEKPARPAKDDPSVVFDGLDDGADASGSGDGDR